MKTHPHIHLQKSCKHISTGSRNTCKQQLVTGGPAHEAFPIHGWAQDMALPPPCWAKVETTHRCLRLAVPGEPGRWLPGRLSMLARCGVFHRCGTQRLWRMDASAPPCTGTMQRSIRRPVGTVHRCFPHCQRGWDLTLPQEAAQDSSVQTQRNSWSQVVAHKTLVHILVFSMWRCQAIAGFLDIVN